MLAENYLQHAEHYNRIIMAYREQFQQPGGGDMPNGNGQRLRGPNDPGEGEDFGDDDGGDDMADEAFSQPPAPQHQGGPPQHQGRQQGGYDSRDNRDNRDRPFRRDQGRFRDRERYNDRTDRGDRNNDRGDRDRGGDRPPQEGRPAQPPQQERQPEAPAEAGGAGDQRRRDRFQQAHEQPEFLRRPVRRTRTESGEPAAPSKEEPRE